MKSQLNMGYISNQAIYLIVYSIVCLVLSISIGEDMNRRMQVCRTHTNCAWPHFYILGRAIDFCLGRGEGDLQPFPPLLACVGSGAIGLGGGGEGLIISNVLVANLSTKMWIYDFIRAIFIL